MGKVLVKALIENYGDVLNRELGTLSSDRVRSVEVTDALVDTGASGLMLPKGMIAKLGLIQFRIRQAKALGGKMAIPIYSAVRLTIDGRDCAMDVGEIADDFPVLIGQIPLEALDFLVDPKGQCLTGNPDHGGEHMMDLF